MAIDLGSVLMVNVGAQAGMTEEVFRHAMAQVCTPVSVVTTFDSRPHGTTVSAFTSLSMEPAMVLVSLDRQSDLLSELARIRRFGVNVLSSGQSALALRFARKGVDTFDGLEWHEEEGRPRFTGAAVWLGCRLERLVSGGDHQVAFGEVTAIHVNEARPLVYHARTFGTHGPEEPTNP
jgi:flavin reductase (DIM6/NTAB) family NADH-FMN oxidoreductase RutF